MREKAGTRSPSSSSSLETASNQPTCAYSNRRYGEAKEIRFLAKRRSTLSQYGINVQHRHKNSTVELRTPAASNIYSLIRRDSRDVCPTIKCNKTKKNNCYVESSCVQISSLSYPVELADSHRRCTTALDYLKQVRLHLLVSKDT